MIPRALASATLKPMVLSILAEGESYGYQIIQRIRDLSEGALQWTTGTLYPFLHELENEGLMESYWQEVEGAPRRKYYRLTEKGLRALAHEKQQWMDVNRILMKLWGASPELAWS
jgi:PadR family transcriptional regulator PadR